MKRLSDVDEARALHVWLLESGDVGKTSKALGKGFGEARIREHASSDFWQLMLARQQRHLQTQAADSALAVKEMEIKMLGTLRTRAFQHLVGKKNPDYDEKEPGSKQYDIRPLRPANFESAGRLLIETIRALHELEEPSTEAAGRPSWMDFVRDQVEKGGEVTISGPKPSKQRDPEGPTKADDDDDPFGLRGSSESRLPDVEDRG